MGGSRGAASEKFGWQQNEQASKAFDAGMPWMKRSAAMARSVIDMGGEPGYLGTALDAATANAQDAGVIRGQMEEQGVTRANSGAVSGGNLRQAFSPQGMGAKMAEIVLGSGVARQNARVAQMFDAAGLGVGMASNAGQLQTQALTDQLRNISMMPAVDPTYSAIVGAANAAGSIYGATRKDPGVTKHIGEGQIANGANSIGIWGQPGQYGPQQYTLGRNPLGISFGQPGPSAGWSGGWR